MTLARRMVFAVVTGWVSRVVSVALSLILIRVLFAKLGNEEQGFWLLLGNSAIFVSLMDLGFSYTLTRRIALARGKSGADPNAVLTDETKKEIADLVATGKCVFRVIAPLVFLVSLGLGFVFLANLQFREVDKYTVWLAWAILCAGYAINVWALVWSCLLEGVGLVGWSTVAQTAVAVVAMILQITLVMLGSHILTMAIVAATSGLIARQVSLFISRRTYPELFKGKGAWSPALFRSMVSLSLRAWVTAMGAFLILKTDQYFISYFQGASQLPPYNAAYQVLWGIFGFAASIGMGTSVYISHLWQAGEFGQLHAVVKRGVRLGMILMVCGAAWVAVAGEPLISLWIGPGRFVGYPVLWTFCLMLILLTHEVILASFSRATEDEAFAVVAVTSGVLNLVFTFFLIQWLGLWGVALGTLLAQLLTGNWYVTYRALNRLKMSKREHFMQVVFPTLVIFLLALGLGGLMVWAFARFESRLITVTAAAIATGTVMLVATWIRGLSGAQRKSIMDRVGVHRLFPVR